MSAVGILGPEEIIPLWMLLDMVPLVSFVLVMQAQFPVVQQLPLPAYRMHLHIIYSSGIHGLVNMIGIYLDTGCIGTNRHHSKHDNQRQEQRG